MIENEKNKQEIPKKETKEIKNNKTLRKKIKNQVILFYFFRVNLLPKADQKDFDDFALENKLVKKLKAGYKTLKLQISLIWVGKISLKEFKKQMKDIDGDDELDLESEDENHYKNIILPKHGNKKKK